MESGRYQSILDYCEKMGMTYSYKPVLILALISHGGQVTLEEAADFFLRFYALRLEQGQIAEKANSIYSNLHCTFEQVKENIKNNPVKALTSSSPYFSFDAKRETFSFVASLRTSMPRSLLSALRDSCYERLDRYYRRIAAEEARNTTAFQHVQDDNGYLNNDYAVPFSVSGVPFSSMTQYMVYRGALLTGQEDLGRTILRKRDPSYLRKLAQQHNLFLGTAWAGQKQGIAYKGLIAKFVQNETLSDRLLDTGSSTIAACLAEDCEWGTGLNRTDRRVYQMDVWPGKNLLGFTLMQVRNTLYSTRTF